MYRFIRKNNKKLLAIFTAFLMIVFILPSYNRMSGQDRNAVIGRIGDEKILANDVRQSQLEWDALKHVLIPGGQQQGQQFVPLIQRVYPQQTIEQLDSHPTMFYLLQREAKKLGAQPNEEAMQQLLQQTALRTDDGRIVPVTQVEPERAELVHAALQHLLLIQAGFEQQADLIKLSQPVKQHQLATQAQQISVDLVEFNSKDFANHVQPPTTQQLQEQFNKYADIPAGTSTANNPLGFGYRYPNRVKLQYLAVPREDVRKAVKSQKEDYLWDVDAQRYYLEHQDLFKTAPTTKPASTQASTKPTTSAVASTQPTTKPFAEVHEDALKAVIDPKIDAMQQDIIGKIKTRLAADWFAYHNATSPASAPTTATASPTSKPAPITGYGVPFDSYEYLQKLAADIQKQTGLLPTVASIADTFKSDKELEALPGIGRATHEFLPFPMYAVVMAQPFLPEAQKNESQALAVWQPSQVLRDDRENDYIFRLTATELAHKPQSLDEVKAAVESDWRKAQAYELAKAKANEVKAAAARSSLSSAATGAGKQVTSTGLFSNRAQGTIPNYNIDPNAVGPFVEKAFDLLTTAAKEKSAHPIDVLELPADGKVIVAQLQDVKPLWRDDASMAYVADMFSENLAGEMLQSIRNHWFDYDNLTNRLDFKEENPRKKDNAKTASVQ